MLNLEFNPDHMDGYLAECIISVNLDDKNFSIIKMDSDLEAMFSRISFRFDNFGDFFEFSELIFLNKKSCIIIVEIGEIEERKFKIIYEIIDAKISFERHYREFDLIRYVFRWNLMD